ARRGAAAKGRPTCRRAPCSCTDARGPAPASSGRRVRRRDPRVLSAPRLSRQPHPLVPSLSKEEPQCPPSPRSPPLSRQPLPLFLSPSKDEPQCPPSPRSPPPSCPPHPLVLSLSKDEPPASVRPAPAARRAARRARAFLPSQAPTGPAPSS